MKKHPIEQDLLVSQSKPLYIFVYILISVDEELFFVNKEIYVESVGREPTSTHGRKLSGRAFRRLEPV